MSAVTASKKTKKVADVKTVEVKAEVKIEPVKKADKVEKVEKADKAAAAESGKKTRVKKEKEVPKEEKEEPKEAVPRVSPTSDSVQAEVVDLLSGLTTAKLNELDNLKSSLKLLKSTASRLKHLRNDLVRVLRKTKREHAPKDKSKLSNSGLMKPVSISKDLAAFMGVDASTLHSRVSVTNSICTYIKEKNLQNPSNKREIVPDDKLVKLLGYKEGAQPLTYFYIQQLIQPHFLKEVSSDLASFMGVSDKSLQSTFSVVSSVLAYANSKGLVNGQDLQTDDKLSKLFGKSGTFSTQNVSQLVKAHFKK